MHHFIITSLQIIIIDSDLVYFKQVLKELYSK